MNNAISRVTLYDMFAMVIPGFLWLMFFYLCCKSQFTTINDYFNDVTSIFLLFIVSYSIGLIYHKAMECLFNIFKFRNNAKCIKKMFDKFCSDFKNDGGVIKEGNEKFPDRHQYYKAYYRLMNNNMLNSIPTLEAQVAFIRNMLLIILLYAICMYSNKSLPKLG